MHNNCGIFSAHYLMCDLEGENRVSFLKAKVNKLICWNPNCREKAREGVIEHINKSLGAHGEKTDGVRENNGAKVPVMEGLKGRKRPAGQVRSALLS